ncbi:hypothetical protein ACHWQZ_G006368 [Mnemiopsis leidyi]|uniref:Protein Wnt n=1 Tax=Mnemiopsis leidyi TaxID=27923 RepID=E3UKC5_MNELE|nr:Wnt9 [Mnemiopsis leidyi]
MEFQSRPCLLSLVLLVLVQPASVHRAVSNTSFTNSSAFSCDKLPGLSARHKSLCRRYPNLMRYVQDGIRRAQEECQTQFRHSRWNCTSIDNRPFLKLLERGFRESAFSYAIVSAGITYMLTNACGEGEFPECFCQGQDFFNTNFTSNTTSFHYTNGSSWHMAGCDDNVEVASNIVLESQRTYSRRRRNIDTRALVVQHNNKVGIQALQDTVTLDCRCHGMSGTCATKTCMRKMPPFSVVGDYLEYKFHGARRVIHKKSGYGLLVASPGRKEPREPRRDELLYYEKSPNFCSADPELNWAGTAGRRCVIAADPRQRDHCDVLCCKRGFYTLFEVRTVDCNCKMESFCCNLTCDRCNTTVPIHYCN